MFKEPNMFANRTAAGRALARQLVGSSYAQEDPVVVCLPYGGIAIGKVIAEELDCDLDVCMVRRILSPTDADIAMAAVTEHGGMHLTNRAYWQTGPTRKYIEEMRLKEIQEMKQRRLLYNTPSVSVRRRTVILVDDGIATGSSILAAVHEIRKSNPAKIIIASPVCSFAAYAKLRRKSRGFAELIILNVPPHFKCVAQFYLDYTPVTDLDIIDALQSNRLKERTRPMVIKSPVAQTRDIRTPSQSSSGESIDNSDVEEEKDEWTGHDGEISNKRFELIKGSSTMSELELPPSALVDPASLPVAPLKAGW